MKIPLKLAWKEFLRVVKGSPYSKIGKMKKYYKCKVYK